MKLLQLIYKKLKDIKQYENNPRNNDEAIKYVAESIIEFGFKVPIVIDKEVVIVAGNTRWKAAKSLNIKEVPCIFVDDLSDQQIKAYRLADNKVAEFAEWDFNILNLELDEPFEVEGRKVIIQVVLVLLVKIYIVDVHYFKGQNGH